MARLPDDDSEMDGLPDDDYGFSNTCPECDGTGFSDDCGAECDYCDGEGYIWWE